MYVQVSLEQPKQIWRKVQICDFFHFYYKMKAILKNCKNNFKNQKNSPNTIKNSFIPFWGLFVQKKGKNSISDP